MQTFLRGAVFNLYLIVLTLVMGIGALPLRLLGRQNLALRYAQVWARAVLVGFSWLCNVRIQIHGRSHLTSGPLLIASQHRSFFDGFIWMTLLPRPSYVIKQELIRIPLVGPMLVLSGMIPVERSAKATALRGMMRAVNTAHEAQRQVILFPEGTRVAPGARHPVQPGIVALVRQSTVPIIPVATDSGQCWPKHFWRKHSGTITVAIGPALLHTPDRAVLAQRLEDAWRSLERSSEIVSQPVNNSVEQ